jgi:hypothetical protein
MEVRTEMAEIAPVFSPLFEIIIDLKDCDDTFVDIRKACRAVYPCGEGVLSEAGAFKSECNVMENVNEGYF